MLIRNMVSEDIPRIIRIWNACVSAGDVLYYPMTEDSFRRKMVENAGCRPDSLLVAEKNGQVAGFLHGGALGEERFLKRAGRWLPKRIRRRSKCSLDGVSGFGLAPAGGVRERSRGAS